MDDGALIALVENYEELYNLKHKDYSNHQRRDNVWEEIGKILNQPEKLCRERWKRIRDNHRKALNLRKTKSGQAASKLKRVKFDKELTFLTAYLFDEENRQSNIQSPQSGQSDVDASSVSTPTISRESTPIMNVRKRKSAIPKISAASVLKDYLQKRSETHQSNQQVNDDPLISFFINMAQTVKTFPMKDQVEIKCKLFEMVNTVEARIATIGSVHHASSVPTSNEPTSRYTYSSYQMHQRQGSSSQGAFPQQTPRSCEQHEQDQPSYAQLRPHIAQDIPQQLSPSGYYYGAN